MSEGRALAAGSLAGRGAIVTGAGSGIGRAIALRLAELGAEVTGIGRTESTLLETSALAAGRGVVRHEGLDVRDPEAVERSVAAIASRQGVHVLVNCAGGQFVSPAADISPRGWRAVVDLNLDAVFSMCRAAHGPLSRDGGSIVNISLSGALRGSMGIAHSVAARAGVIGLTRTLALEWAADRITANCIGPGTVLTDGLARYGDPETLDRLRAGTPAGRFTQEAEVAELTAFLASPAAAMITGQFLHCDGGAHLGAGLHMIAP